jgi:PAS domain S-box-containing protein
VSWVLSGLLLVAGAVLLRRLRHARAACRATLARERALRSDLRNVLANLGSGLVIADRRGIIQRANPAAARILGVQETDLAGQAVADAFDEGRREFARAVVQVLAGGEAVSRREIGLDLPDGRRLPVGISVHPVRDESGCQSGAVAIFQDLSEVNALRERMRENDRLAAIGELSASIAHEIRNPLGSIRGSAELLAAELAVGGQEQRLLALILKESERVNRIVSDFLAYARLRPTVRQLSELKPFLEDVAFQVRMHQQGREGLHIETGIEPDDLLVLMDPEQMQQVLLNLALNACEAMGGRGTLSLRASLDDDNTACRLVVADTGPGIAPEVRDTLFRPFVTTKAGGTGLGLPVVQRIVLAHGGDIRAGAGPRGGAEFRIDLPLVLDTAAAPPPAAEPLCV